MPLRVHRPQSIEEAVEAKERLGSAAHFLAGGTELNPRLVDIGASDVILLEGLSLDRIDRVDGAFVIGPCCTVQSVIDARDLPECVRAAARQLPNRSIRNMATIGGQLAGIRRCSDMVPVLVALDALVTVVNPGGAATIPVLDYVESRWRPLLTQVRIREEALDRRVAVGRESRAANGTALLSAAVSLKRMGDRIAGPVAAVCGLSHRVVRLSKVEQELDGGALPSEEAIEQCVASELVAVADEEGAAGLRGLLAGVLVARIAREAYRQEGVAAR
jgi:putative selenate reductase FAD-binding subunit